MKWEFELLWDIQHHLVSAAGDKVMIFLSTIGDNGMVWIALAFILLLRSKWRKAGIAMLIALLVAHIVGNLTVKPLVGRLRPYMVDPSIHLKIPPLNEFSFPSGHTISSFAAAFAISDTLRSLRYSAMVLATAIGFSRLYLFMHFPTDVIGGALLGAVIGYGVRWIVNKYKPENVDKYYENQG